MESDSAKHLFPIVKDGKYGFIDAAGRICLKPAFDRASQFSEGLARVCVHDKWGFIDTSGDMVIAPSFDSCLDFSEDFAVVTSEDKQGFINRNGEIKIAPTFYKCDPFHEGLAKVQHTVVSKPFFIDPSGEIVLDHHNYLVSQLREGLINCPEQGRWGYIDKSGVFAIPAKYVYARPFSEGLAAVCPQTEEECVFIDKQGHVVIETPLDGADILFSEGLCAVWSEHGGYGFIDRTGRLVIRYSFYYADHFADGMAAVRPKESGGYGFIDQAGRIVVSPRFAVVEKFHKGLASVTIGDNYEEYQYGYINKTGTYVWEPTR